VPGGARLALFCSLTHLAGPFLYKIDKQISFCMFKNEAQASKLAFACLKMKRKQSLCAFVENVCASVIYTM
jgi:hypothetical protein